MNVRHLLDLLDVSDVEITALLRAAGILKDEYRQGVRRPLLERRMIALLFEKPSLRTRVSFEAAIAHLGGNSLYLGKDVGWGGRETIADFTRALSRYVDTIIFRGHEQAVVEEMARASRCPVVNGLTHQAHPCQALGDLLTIQERWGTLPERKVAFIGDANNVSRSLAVATTKMGMRFAWACPEGYAPDHEFLQALARHAPQAHLVEIVREPQEAVRGAHVVYTDVWVSMGDEAERAERERQFTRYRVDQRLMRQADPDAIFMHCLPARRGEEVTSEVMDSPQSVVFEQAENRLHMQKAILVWLLRGCDQEMQLNYF